MFAEFILYCSTIYHKMLSMPLETHNVLTNKLTTFIMVGFTEHKKIGEVATGRDASVSYICLCSKEHKRMK